LKDEGASDSDLLASTGAQSSAASTMQQQHQQYLGDVDVVLQNFPEIDWGSTPIPGNVLYCLMYTNVLSYNIKLVVMLLSLMCSLFHYSWYHRRQFV